MPFPQKKQSSGNRFGNKKNNGFAHKKRRIYQSRRGCIFCKDSSKVLNYKDPKLLRAFITERGKIIPKRITGTCAKHQRLLAHEIKRARTIALLPYVGTLDYM